MPPVRPWLAVLLSAMLLGGCQTSHSPLRPAQMLQNYDDLSHRPFLERIVPIPPLLLDELRVGDHRPDYQPHQLSTPERSVIETTWRRLPAELRAVVEARVVGVYFLDQFEGGGMTYSLWKNGKAKYVLVFNAKILTATISQWLTFRDNTAFALAGTQYRLEESVPGDDPALLWLLIHESAHVFDFAAHPHKPAFGRDFPRRKDLHFYDVEPKPKVAASEVTSVFDNFSKSGFPSLYGSQNGLEDFAELVACGTLEETMGIPVELKLSSPDGTTRTFDALKNAETRKRIDLALAELAKAKTLY